MQMIVATTYVFKCFCMDCNNLLINYFKPLYNLNFNRESFRISGHYMTWLKAYQMYWWST